MSKQYLSRSDVADMLMLTDREQGLLRGGHQGSVIVNQDIAAVTSFF